MPCRDYEDSYSYGHNSSQENKDLRKQNDRLARIACKVLTSLEELDREELLLQILSDQEVREWWEKHKEADRIARIAREATERKARIKRDALAKLTDEEKKVLGIKK